MTDTEIALSGADFTRDPHPTYQRLNADGPVHRVTLAGGIPAWLVTDRDVCREVLNDPRFSKDMAGTWHAFQRQEVPLTGDVVIGMGDSMLVSDPPRHTRLRSLVSKGFTARRIERLAPHIEATAHRLVERLRAGDGTADIVADYAALLPMQTICPLLGVPEEDGLELRLAIETVMSSDDTGQEAAFAAFERVHGYLAGHVAAKADAPGDDLTTALIEAREDGDRLSNEELVSMLALLLSAGHETTVNLIASMTLALLAEPGARQALRADPERWGDAVEETLRWDGPIQNALWRFTRAEVSIGGVQVPAGEAVAVSLASANRDAGKVECPHAFDLDRAERHHLAFGHGIHHCLGAGLARLEGRIAGRVLFDAFPDMRLLDEPEYRRSTVSRAPLHVRVALG